MSVRGEVVPHALRPQALLAEVAAAGNGATALFVGVVRDEGRGGRVVSMTYDAYAPMANRVLAAIVADAAAAARGALSVAVEHRVGTLAVGEASVAIAVGAPHRAEAFDACRRVIEEIKTRLPVWKQEHYDDGTSRWLDGQRPPSAEPAPAAEAAPAAAATAVRGGAVGGGAS